MRHLFDRETSQRFFAELQGSPHVSRFGCMISEFSYSGRVKLCPDGRFFRFTIQFDEYQRCLAQNKGDKSAAISQLIQTQLTKISMLNALPARFHNAPPLFCTSTDNWQQPTDTLAALLFSQLGLAGDEHVTLQLRLTFYDDVTLIALAPKPQPSSNNWRYFLACQGDFYILNGLAAPIIEVNRKASLRLHSSQALDYLRFFSFFSQGEQGSFFLITAPEQCALPEVLSKEENSELRFDSGIEHYYIAPKVSAPDDAGNYQVRALVYYGNSLFAGIFTIDQDGTIKMTNEQLLASHLPYTLSICLTP
ncbi:hypothetical protein [Bowmanella yangjiangensis]|uniref:Uncharacterized protein n=1 Tax=Bowmanella yangjiangensis TaxID=2811230 RepID=A0ABS3CRM3_9ALTE|nr:hypothetical protein [Bowmanella yangjiangensis]MBN7819763.1 hypothetical protein [Bowmanella yangjiangensis]